MTDLTTLASVQTYLGSIADGDVAEVNALITAVSAWVRSVTSRDISVTTYSKRFDGLNNQRVVLPQWPIVSVASVAVGARMITAQSGPGQPGYFFDDDSIILDCDTFDRGMGNVTIAWTAGYNPVPADIEQAVNEVIGLRLKQREQRGWVSKTLAGETVALDMRDMPSSVKTTLAQYTRWT